VQQTERRREVCVCVRKTGKERRSSRQKRRDATGRHKNRGVCIRKRGNERCRQADRRGEV
jgi:hypothetical protein